MEINIETDLQEIFRQLEASGMNPRLCTIPVPCYSGGIHAGTPAMPGDITVEEHMFMAGDVLMSERTYIVDVVGDSMRDVDIMPGDQLLVRHIEDPSLVRDGDAVIAWVAGQNTVKAFMRDEQGNAWLVPRNPKYAPFRITGDMRITGLVIRCIKSNTSSAYADLARILKKAQLTPEPTPPSEKAIAQAVLYICDSVSNGRQWFAVYRALADTGAIRDNDFTTFANLVADLLPEHPCLPVVSEMRRMNVQSFRKPLHLWKPYDAPVSGSIFEKYARLAQEMKERLEG